MSFDHPTLRIVIALALLALAVLLVMRTSAQGADAALPLGGPSTDSTIRPA